MTPRPVLAALTMAGGLLLGACVTEALLRVTRPHAAGVSRMPTIYERDPVLGYRYRPLATGRMQRLFEIDNLVRINSAGFHDEEHPLDGQRPIVVVGDSMTAALHVPIRGTWTQVLQAQLRASLDPSIHVFNLGLDGTGSDVHLELLKENLEPLDPGVVIVAFFANDVADVRDGRIYREVRDGYVLQWQNETQAQKMRQLADRMQERRLGRWLFRRLYLWRLAVFAVAGERNLLRTNVINPAHVGELRSAAPRHEDSVRRIFDEFRRLAAAFDQHLFVVPVPQKGDGWASLRIFRGAVEAGSLETLDVMPALRTELEREGRSFDDLYWRHDLHLNAYGNELFGRAVAQALEEHLRP